VVVVFRANRWQACLCDNKAQVWTIRRVLGKKCGWRGGDLLLALELELKLGRIKNRDWQLDAHIDKSRAMWRDHITATGTLH
jgi:hypothetical protein